MHTIRYQRIVYLSHVLEPGMPHWPGDPALSAELVASLATDGYRLRRVSFGEHAGTHLVARSSYEEAGWGIDELAAARLVHPAVVIDVQEKAALASDYALSADDLLRWEARHGKVEAGVLVILHTGWHRRWSAPRDYLGLDDSGGLHFPGFGEQAACLLLERGVAGLATDTAGLEVGADRTYAVSRLVLAHDRLVVENLARVDELPSRGATVVLGPLRLRGGTGAPATVLALLP